MSTSIDRLIGNFDQTSVERAIAELRAGRPVIVTDGDRASLVAAVESIDAGMARGMARAGSSEARLVMTAARLQHLGLDRETAGAFALPVIDLNRIRLLSHGVSARADAPVGATSVLDRAGLELAALALVLPALVVVPLAESHVAGESLAIVRAEAIERFRATASADLSIISRAPVPLEGAPETEFVVFRGGEGLRDQVAIVIGKPDPKGPVAVRIHSACLTGDLFGSLKCDCGDQLRLTVRWMAENGGGILLYLDQEGRGNGLSNKIMAYGLQAKGLDTFEADATLGFGMDQRRFDFAAEMLRQLGVKRVILLTNNPAKIAAIRRSGIELVDHRRVYGRRTPENVFYMTTKRDRASHLIDIDDELLRDAVHE